MLPVLALPSILFRIGAGFGISWLAEAAMLVAAPFAWALLAAGLGLLVRGRGARVLGLGVWLFYGLSFVAPLLLIRVPTVARWAVRSEGDAARTGAVETLARSGGPGDVSLLTGVLEDNHGVYRQIHGAVCGATRWGGVEAWRRWAGTPAGSESLPGVIWIVVDVLAHPGGCPGPPIPGSQEERDEVRIELVRQTVTGQIGSADTGERYHAFELLRDQIPPAERGPYLPALVESLGDSFWLDRAGALRLLLEVREGRPIPDPVRWVELGEVEPESASAAQVEECRQRWARWFGERRAEGAGTGTGP